jgi:hypothetical protein
MLSGGAGQMGVAGVGGPKMPGSKYKSKVR